MLPKGVWFQKKTLADGSVVRYGYLGRGPGSISLGRENTAEFHRKLACALDRGATARNVHFLVARYLSSPEFRQLRERTQRDYRQQLDRIKDEFGALSLGAMSSPRISEHIYEWRDSRRETPRQADYGIQVLKLLLSWGKGRGLLDLNRAEGIKPLYSSDRSEKVWSDHEVDLFLRSAPEALRLALLLGVETGQRQADLLKLTWGAVKDGTIHLRQGKGQRVVVVPISPRLQAALESASRGDATTILVKQDGRPWEPKGNGFRAAWRDACKAAGIVDRHYHDLRGTFVTNRFAEGWRPDDIAFCTGHSMRDMAMLEKYMARDRVAEARAQTLKGRFADEPRTKIAN